MDASKKRSEEWKQLKGQKKNQLKAKFKEEFRSWMTNEKSTRLKEDRKRRKREYKQLRVVYLDGRIDKIYQDKNSAVDHQSSTPQEAMDNTADEGTKSAQESKETQDLNIQGSGSRIPSKKAKNLR